MRKFLIELIKPTHYDDDGYTIQWKKAWVPSNSLGCLYGLCTDLKKRYILGDDVKILVNAYDESNTIIPIKKIIQRFNQNNNSGLVCMVGVQTNQYPRAIDLAKEFRNQGINVAIGGFHVSGSIAMFKEMPAELKEALDLGIILFAGEAEDRLEQFFLDVFHGCAKPLYNFMNDLPSLENQPLPFLPDQMVRRYADELATYDAGRGCPYLCSFCTIINVQGRKSRYRTADDVEQLLRINITQGTKRMFITDDNFARNRNWEAIFDRLIELRENQNIGLDFTMQVDTMCGRIPNFIEKAACAGCSSVFIGLESINAENLNGVRKKQNRVGEYRNMLLAWRNVGVVTYCGYILGFPSDTPESIERDINLIQDELPIDILEFFFLTPLPGSADHKQMSEAGKWMNPDLNIYDLEHVTTSHEIMSHKQWEDIYNKAWDLYYSPQHVKTLIRRAVASGINPIKIVYAIMRFHGSIRFEGVHPLQSGFSRLKLRKQRRPSLQQENALLFLLKHSWKILSTKVRYQFYLQKLLRLMKKIQADPESSHYTDKALTLIENAPCSSSSNSNSTARSSLTA